MRAPLLFLFLLLASLSRAELIVDGVDDELQRNVRSYISLATEPCNAESWLVQRRFRAIDGEIRTALQPFGYYDPVIETSLDQAGDCWSARASIDVGQPVLLRNVSISLDAPAEDRSNFDDLVDVPALKPNSRLRHADYASLKESLQVRAAERGYIEASFLENSISVWPEELAADLNLNFQTGPRYNFGEIALEQSLLDESLVRAFLEFEPGMPYDNRLLTRAYDDLSRSGYFGRIELIPQFEEASDRQLPMLITLEPAARIEYTVGLGLSTDTGPRARAGFQNRRVNQRGHRLQADLSVSSVLQGLSAEYRRPLADPRSEWLSYTSSVSSESTDSSESDTARIGVRRSKRIRPEWMRTLFVDLSYERYNIGGVANRSRLALPGIVYDHKRSDRDVYPTRGRRLTAELRGTAEFLGSDTSFLQTIVSARLVRSLSADSRLLARATVGLTGQSDFLELPPSVRFFAGGDESVRGFDYETLGPTDDQGHVIGGRSLLTASIEYQRRLRGDFFGAVFVDAGNAFDGSDIDPAVGAGIGLIWRSPVGPLRIYLAHPMNKSDRDVRLHVQLGADL
jgi:translocation and assembly module TamA